MLPETKIFDAIQGFIEFSDDKEPIYLFNGEWYVFDTKYTTALNNEYVFAYENHIKKNEVISNKFSLLHKVKTENVYNKTLESEKSIFVTHTVLMNNVEIAYAIFGDGSTVYLMHNKRKFNGEGVRDVINQILTSADYMQKVIQGINRDEWLKKYYNEIITKRAKIAHAVNQKEFLTVMTSNNICYIAGYLSGFKKNISATYAKYLTIEAEKRLSAKGYGFVSMNITK